MSVLKIYDKVLQGAGRAYERISKLYMNELGKCLDFTKEQITRLAKFNLPPLVWIQVQGIDEEHDVVRANWFREGSRQVEGEERASD